MGTQDWKKYRRVGELDMRRYVPGEDLSHVSVSDEDDPPNDHGFIARNPANHDDQWYVGLNYALHNYEEVC